jgi:hypothetical protein
MQTHRVESVEFDEEVLLMFEQFTTQLPFDQTYPELQLQSVELDEPLVLAMKLQSLMQDRDVWFQ